MRKQVWTILKNRYFIVTAAFVIWVGFFDQNNLIHQQMLRSELKAVQKERTFYLNEIDRDTRTYLEIVGSNERLEKFAREKYLVKRDNEDVFLIVYE